MKASRRAKLHRAVRGQVETFLSRHLKDSTARAYPVLREGTSRERVSAILLLLPYDGSMALMRSRSAARRR